LAHGKGSRNTNIILVQFSRRAKERKFIETPQRGDGALKRTAHVYVNKEQLPKEYTKVIDKNAKQEGRLHDVGEV